MQWVTQARAQSVQIARVMIDKVRPVKADRIGYKF